ncbi:serine hydrolase domain-containing protein [Streptomyces sp. NPDC091280]|uniref:serine hydrolase domain-containing protein n=1 Tax=Streptomyces sp. NPDC091280 TaxID=3365984 RepID=UPI00382D3CD1
MTQEIHGTVADGFETVREEFAAFVSTERADYEGQLCAYVHGRRVVDLWAGPGTAADSLYGVFSSTKGAAHLVVALLVQDGTLELDRKVTYYWPEFASEGKGALTLRELLAHRAGLVGTDTGFTLEELADDRAVAERLADQRPFWRPGTAFGYHALVIGALTGEIVRRATGRSLQDVYEERVRAPYGLDLFLGLPAAQEPRFRSTRLPSPADGSAPRSPEPDSRHSLAGIAFNEHAAQPTELALLPNERVIRAKGPASVGAVASARGLAGLYAAAISEFGDRAPLLKPDTAAEFGQLHSVGHDLVTGTHRAYGLGFQATASTWYPFLGAGTIGHSGAAGSQAFADPRTGLAYGYTRRRFALPGGAAPENLRFVEAAHRAALAG